MSSPHGNDVSYMYGGRRRSPSMQEIQRDPRKRRPPIGSDNGTGVAPAEPSISRKLRSDRGQRGRSPSSSRSRSGSPGGSNQRDLREHRSGVSNTRDEWTKTTDAFLKNLGTAANKSEQVGYDIRSHGGYPPPQHPGYPTHGVSSHYPYSSQHASSIGLVPMNVPPPGMAAGFSGQPSSHHSTSSHGHDMDRHGQSMEQSGGGRPLSPREVGSRKIDPGHSNTRNDREDRNRKQKSKSHGNGTRSDDASSDSSSSLERGRKESGAKKKEQIQGITLEQREKLMTQQKQYLDAKLKLEDQLLKLKEEREALKQGGNTHEDKIMRENAKLQKEVKTRVQYVVEVLGKIEAALKMPVIRNDKARSASRTPEKEERRIRRMSPDEYEDSSKERRRRNKKVQERKRSVSETSSREPSEDKEIKKRRKQKEPSSSENESENHGPPGDGRKKIKKKRKRSKKSKGSSSDLSYSDCDQQDKGQKKIVAEGTSKGVIQVDESLFRMMTNINGAKADGLSGQTNASSKGSSDEMVMGLLSKMSEAYMNSKNENKELIARNADLEDCNEDLERRVNKQQKKIDKLKRKIQKFKQQERDSDFVLSDQDTEKGESKSWTGRPRSHAEKKEMKRNVAPSNSNDHIPDILLGDVLKIKRGETLSPSTSRSSSITRNSATAAATARVVQSIDSFKAPKLLNLPRAESPIEEKREISIRGASPPKQPPERLTSRDAEIVRSVRTRMMEKEKEHRKRGTQEDREVENERQADRERDRERERERQKQKDWEMEKERERQRNIKQEREKQEETDKQERDRRQEREYESERRHNRDLEKEREREGERNLEKDTGRRERVSEINKERSRSKDLERGRERSRSGGWDRKVRRSSSRSRDRSRSKDRIGRARSKSRERSKSPEERGRRKERSRSHSNERYDRRYDDRRSEERGRFGHDGRRDARQRELDRIERRQREKERETEREKEKENERERQRMRDREYEDERKEKERSRLIKEKNEKINIDEWTTKPSETKNPALMSIKEKLRQKEEEEEEVNNRRKQHMEEEERRQKWSNVSSIPEQQKEEAKPVYPENPRPQVAIQWGQRDKLTPDPQLSGMAVSGMKKNIPMVGKMPWLQRSRKSEERQNMMNTSSTAANATNIAIAAAKKSSRFGPPSAVSTSIPPPMVLSDVPPPSSVHAPNSGPIPVPPPAVPPPMQIHQAIHLSDDAPSVVPLMSSFVPPAPQHTMLNNPTPSQLDITSMLEAAKEHINRSKESKKEPKSTYPDQLALNVVKDESTSEIEIPLPPLPAAKDKDPSAMVDTRLYKTTDFDADKAHKSKMEATFEKNTNLPPGFNRNVPTVTVQHTPSAATHQPPSVMGSGPALQGPPPHGAPFYGQPGAGYYGGPPGGQMTPNMQGHSFTGPGKFHPMPQQNEAKEKQEHIESDPSELAMLGIDPSDFAEFGS